MNNKQLKKLAKLVADELKPEPKPEPHPHLGDYFRFQLLSGLTPMGSQAIRDKWKRLEIKPEWWDDEAFGPYPY